MVSFFLHSDLEEKNSTGCAGRNVNEKVIDPQFGTGMHPGRSQRHRAGIGAFDLRPMSWSRQERGGEIWPGKEDDRGERKERNEAHECPMQRDGGQTSQSEYVGLQAAPFAAALFGG